MTKTSTTMVNHPIIPRYWWLKRICAGGAMMLLLLCLLRIVWGWDASRRVEGMLATIRSRRQPTRPEDFNSPRVADENNYVYFLEQAIAAMNNKVESPAQSDLDYLPYL